MLLFHRRHTLAYVSDLGKVFSFGSGEGGQLGNGATHHQLIPLPMKLPSNEELKFGKFCRSTGFGINTFVKKLIFLCVRWQEKKCMTMKGVSLNMGFIFSLVNSLKYPI